MLFYRATFYCHWAAKEPGSSAADNRQHIADSILLHRGDHRYLRNYNEMLRKAVATWTTFCFVVNGNENIYGFTVAFP